MSRAFHVPRIKRLRHMQVPAVTGYIFAGFRFAVIVGWNAVLLSEWFSSSEGVGWRSRYWYDANRYRGFVAWVILFIGFIVLLDRLVLVRLQRRPSAGATHSSPRSSVRRKRSTWASRAREARGRSERVATLTTIWGRRSQRSNGSTSTRAIDDLSHGGGSRVRLGRGAVDAGRAPR